MQIHCDFEKTVPLLESIFSFYCDRLKDSDEDIYQEDFRYLTQNYPELFMYADYYVYDKICITFYMDKGEYPQIKERFEKMLEAFGCYSINTMEENDHEF